ncbi:MAG: tRNA (guanine(46)-N(7))-methyltransferase, partial [uncultured Pseudonocardia sp.]
ALRGAVPEHPPRTLDGRVRPDPDVRAPPQPPHRGPAAGVGPLVAGPRPGRARRRRRRGPLRPARLVRPQRPGRAGDRLGDGRVHRRARRRRARRRPHRRRGVRARPGAAAHAHRRRRADQPRAAPRRRADPAPRQRPRGLPRRRADLLPGPVAQAPPPQAPPGPARRRGAGRLPPPDRRHPAPGHRLGRLRHPDARRLLGRTPPAQPLRRRLDAQAGVATGHQVRGARPGGGPGGARPPLHQGRHCFTLRHRV